MPETGWMQAKKESRTIFFLHRSFFIGNGGDWLSVIPNIDGREGRHKICSGRASDPKSFSFV
jgi:hypothetical protein